MSYDSIICSIQSLSTEMEMPAQHIRRALPVPMWTKLRERSNDSPKPRLKLFQEQLRRRKFAYAKHRSSLRQGSGIVGGIGRHIGDAYAAATINPSTAAKFSTLFNRVVDLIRRIVSSNA